jgi:hypothetical protein
LRADAEQNASSTLDDVVAPLDVPRRGGLSNFHALNGNRNGAASNGTPRPQEPAARLEAVPEPEVQPESQPESQPTADSEPVSVPAAEPEPAAEEAPAAAAEPTYDLLDSRSPMPEPTEDETPIFRTLRSRWLSSGDDATWTKSEIEAGWEAAEQVAEAPAPVSQSGLPMRRPGNRLVPGGVSPAPAAPVSRDPEAIRARLAAHAAGVSRGRTAAVDEHVPAQSTTTEEGPA